MLAAQGGDVVMLLTSALEREGRSWLHDGPVHPVRLVDGHKLVSAEVNLENLILSQVGMDVDDLHRLSFGCRDAWQGSFRRRCAANPGEVPG